MLFKTFFIELSRKVKIDDTDIMCYNHCLSVIMR